MMGAIIAIIPSDLQKMSRKASNEERILVTALRNAWKKRGSPIGDSLDMQWWSICLDTAREMKMDVSFSTEGQMAFFEAQGWRPFFS
jgi:lambda repressor-like predicted transcriptional regulator